MHTCLSVSNVGAQWNVEHPISDLLERLDAYCAAIDTATIAVFGPSGEGEARYWRVDVKLRVFDETVRATARLPEGPDPARSLSSVLADVYASATVQLAHIAKQHPGSCPHSAEGMTERSKVCA